MDFVRNRMFRQTLLVSKNVKLTRNLSPEVLKDCWFSSALRPVSAEPNFAAGQKEEFRTPTGASISTDNAVLKLVLAALGRAYPGQLSFADLIKDLRVNLLGNVSVQRDAQVERQEEAFLSQQLMVLFGRGLVEVTAVPFPSIGLASERPAVTTLARYQALNSRVVSNLRHVAIGIDVFSRHLLSLLDGTRDRNELLNELVAKTKAGALTVQNNGVAVTDEEQLRKILAPRVSGVIDQFAKLGYILPA